ncbi:MAG TPA: hypothetical protein VK891_06435 [Euzebyales bacterium]|nr:hypothetical protein [Euzebyales bacterium]
MTRRLSRGGLTVALVLVAGYTLVVVATGQVPVWTRATRVCAQPSSVTYDDGTYAVHVLTPTFVPALMTPPTRAVIGRSGGASGVHLELNPSTDATAVTCTWTPDHVEVIEPNGIVHRVPARVFVDGR